MTHDTSLFVRTSSFERTGATSAAPQLRRRAALVVRCVTASFGMLFCMRLCVLYLMLSRHGIKSEPLFRRESPTGD